MGPDSAPVPGHFPAIEYITIYTVLRMHRPARRL